MFEAFMAIAALLSAGTGVYAATRKPNQPQMPDAPPPPPTIDDATIRQQQSNAMLRRRGRAATLLTGEGGAGLPQTAAKTLLGS